MAHTPAPWAWRWSQPLNTLVIEAGDGYIARNISNDNARLIAAAPELLVVVKRVIALANCAMEYEGVDDAHTLKRAMERISKAKRECERVVAKATLEGTNGKERSLD